MGCGEPPSSVNRDFPPSIGKLYVTGNSLEAEAELWKVLRELRSVDWVYDVRRESHDMSFYLGLTYSQLGRINEARGDHEIADVLFQTAMLHLQESRILGWVGSVQDVPVRKEMCYFTADTVDWGLQPAWREELGLTDYFGSQFYEYTEEGLVKLPEVVE